LTLTGLLAKRSAADDVDSLTLRRSHLSIGRCLG